MRFQIRLVTFQNERGETYRYLSNRLDLSALTIIRLYLWRWEIEMKISRGTVRAIQTFNLSVENNLSG